MKYRIKKHVGFKFRRPVRRHDSKDSANKNKAWKADPGENLKVNILVMAKDKKKNKREGRVTAGELFGKLGRRDGEKPVNGAHDGKNADDSEFLTDSIDVTDDSGENDSELDINELLRKYMPDYDSPDGGSDSGADEAKPSKGGVLSRLKKTEPVPVRKSEDEQLIDSLDNAFGIPENDTFASDVNDRAVSDKAGPEDESDAAENRSGYRSDGVISEYEILPESGKDDEADILPGTDDITFGGEELPDSESAGDGFADEDRSSNYDSESEFLDDAAENEADAAGEAVKEKKKSRFSFFGRKQKAEEVLEDISDTADTAEDAGENGEKPSSEEDNPVPDAEIGETEAENESEDAPADELTDEASDDSVAYDSDVDDSGSEESDDLEDLDDLDLDDDIDPTDINLMVAFGLDADENKKAKEFGDRLEAKQQSRETKTAKLDRPEFVDKTQIPKIRKEFHDRKIALWIKLSLCAVFTVLLMIFENIPALTKLFTGVEKQFAGAFDPAVYPTVYIMVSLQLMLLACFCAFDEIVAGFKYLFRGVPRPESMTALLTVAGIVYSAVLSVIIESPAEPVMFNFAAAVSALLTLVYALYNNKREMMNFAIIANRKPKHIVRRLPDEESEGEARAFADNDDVCDVMKIEKTDFIDGFFGRLQRPDSTTGVFMTFAMSVSVAVGALFGILVNFRGGDGAMICRVVYSAMLLIAPMSAYVTFSYPFYRANVAAKEYDSAIIGEASLDEYSNASIISFDDKNVFPSYSVKVQNMRIYNNARIDRVLYYAASVFAYAGGPLQDVFEVATRDMGISKNVKIYDTEAGFLATQVDGVNIIFGSAANLQKRGLDIPDDALKDDVDLSDELSIMYMFRENKLVSKMYIKYVMDSDIDLILKQFSGSGLYVCVRTFDPNIDEKMIAKKAGMKKMPLKIVRYASADEVGMYEEKVDSGLVTCGSPKSLLQIISYCGKVLHTKKTDIALGVLSVMIGLAILVLLLLADSLTALSSILIVLYQLIWLIPITIASNVFIR
ncbi:MAG: hypothetical protein ACI4XJ_10695 [Eubacteriales bacterium]